MKKYLCLAGAILILTSGGALAQLPEETTSGKGAPDPIDREDTSPAGGLVGSFFVGDGPEWTDNPPTFTCLETCADLFGGSESDYECSTANDSVDNMAWASAWGTDQHCEGGAAGPVGEAFKVGDFYDCGVLLCSVSAYVRDNCGAGAPDSENFCHAAAVPSTPPWALMALVALLLAASLYVLRYKRLTS